MDTVTTLAWEFSQTLNQNIEGLARETIWIRHGYEARYMHGLECLDLQLCSLPTSCSSIAGPCPSHSNIVKPNTYLGRAKERWMQSLA